LNFPKRENCKIIIINDFENKWIRGIVEQLVIPFMALKNNVDFIFMPATFGLFIPVKKVVTFVHTNTHFVLDPTLRGRSRIQQYAHLFLTKITKITSSRLAFTSEQTYLEYQKYSKSLVPKFILGNGLLKPYKLANYILPCGLMSNRYFLSISQFYRLKNYDSLIAAFFQFKELLGERDHDFKLVIVGTIQESDYYKELVDMCQGREDVFFLHDLTDEMLNQLYMSARGYCFYSRFEGYSLTPGEALVAGVNIAISNIPTHREIYKSIPFYANPDDICSIVSSLVDLYYTQDNQSDLSEYKSVIASLSFDDFVARLESLFDDINLFKI